MCKLKQDTTLPALKMDKGAGQRGMQFQKPEKARGQIPTWSLCGVHGPATL